MYLGDSKQVKIFVWPPSLRDHQFQPDEEKCPSQRHRFGYQDSILYQGYVPLINSKFVSPSSQCGLALLHGAAEIGGIQPMMKLAFLYMTDQAIKDRDISLFWASAAADEFHQHGYGFLGNELTNPDFDFTSIIAPDNRSEFIKKLAKHKKGKDLPPCEYKLLTKHGVEVDAVIATKLITYEKKQAMLNCMYMISSVAR